MKIAIVQMDIIFGEPEKNFAHVEQYIKEAAKENVDVIVLPEMWNTGYALERLDELADQNGEKTQDLISRLAQVHQVNIVAGSVSTKKEDGFYNTMYIANRNGEIIADYDKAHLFKLMDEHKYLNPGQKMNVFEIDGIKCGGMICYDLRFPEWTRKHTLSGAQVMFIPAEWPKARIDHWKILLQARAIENQCFIVAVNRVGADPNNAFNGHSMVIAPWGDLLICNKTEEGIFYTELDINQVSRVRKEIPVYEDRRVDLYN
ncbi:carbon-nitrogen family hydrolase [Oceanobacillus piezotolerans]|uniref:Carbon-nitrogen family hydrolase n=1 Tax=Oceanobacillus piezotolerans TaxID=2448030 RepID=A0A498D988_9BACI|nr:carbon-nitrogen family hydrolase [Oceanobacillus piezotolerans]RLL43757.1 carbon-nitrogen family hydrolase [Oceanobacillus piezotolerans]